MFRSRLICVLLGLSLATPALADEDHEFARDAFARGEIVSLARILPRLETRYEARLIDAEIERDHGTILYEITLITGAGRLIEVQVDAQTGEILTGENASAERTGTRSDDHNSEEEDDD